jgi:hypothetical protein
LKTGVAEYLVVEIVGQDAAWQCVARLNEAGRLVVLVTRGPSRAICDELEMLDSVHVEDLGEAVAASVHHLRGLGWKIGAFDVWRRVETRRVELIAKNGRFTAAGRQHFEDVKNLRIKGMDRAIKRIAMQRRAEIGAGRRAVRGKRRKAHAENPAG